MEKRERIKEGGEDIKKRTGIDEEELQDQVVRDRTGELSKSEKGMKTEGG